jgi:hypothetical protein
MSESPPSPSDLALLLLLTGVYTLLRPHPAPHRDLHVAAPLPGVRRGLLPASALRAARAVALRHLAPLQGGYPRRRGVQQGRLHPHLRVPPPLLLQQPCGPPDVRRSISPARLGGTLT